MSKLKREMQFEREKKQEEERKVNEHRIRHPTSWHHSTLYKMWHRGVVTANYIYCTRPRDKNSRFGSIPADAILPYHNGFVAYLEEKKCKLKCFSLMSIRLLYSM